MKLREILISTLSIEEKEKEIERLYNPGQKQEKEEKKEGEQ